MSRLFIARYDITAVDFLASNPTHNIWRVIGNIEDPTGSFTASAVSTYDKIVMRGYHQDGFVVYDRYEITSIISASGNSLTVDITYEVPATPNTQYTGDPIPQIIGNTPITGSFPIGSDLAYKDFMRMPSTYQHMIDPDYSAGMDALNFEQIVDTSDQLDYGFNELPDDTRQRFTTIYDFVPGSVRLHVNGVEQRKGSSPDLGFKEEYYSSDGGTTYKWVVWIFWPPETASGLIVEYKRA